VRGLLLTLGGILLAVLSACGPREPACPNGSDAGRFLTEEELALAMDATPSSLTSPVEVEIGSRTHLVDKVVSGPLCNDIWRGTVYVTCDARVAAWSDQEGPEFLKGCDLEVAPGTVAYVAAHYNTAYYEGCSCHTGEIGGP